MESKVIQRFSDPVKFCRLVWPEYRLYNKQKEILRSLRDNYETIVPAGNELGKDFIAGMAVLWFFVSRRPCRVVTTSVDSGQLEDVLWGEIRRFIADAAVPLPIEYTHLHLFQVDGQGKRIPRTEVVGRVVKKGEGLLGRHVARTKLGEPTTLLVADEASGIDHEVYEKADTWTHRKLVIGNPYPCSNFFFMGAEKGDEPSAKGNNEEVLYRKVIRITAEDSPNVQYARAEMAAGREVSHTLIVPGVLSYADMVQRREQWDAIRQSIGLDAQFYKGSEILLFPPDWLNRCEINWYNIPRGSNRVALGIGIDPAEGGDSTCYAAVDGEGLIELVSHKTPDTSEIYAFTQAFMIKHGLNPLKPSHAGRVCFDRGGGGKQHADYLRNKGILVRTVGFGESATLPLKQGMKLYEDQKRELEQRYAYKNKRAELYGRLRLRMDPSIETSTFSFAPTEHKLRQQLSPIPLVFDEEGRLKLPPKNKRDKNSREVTLIDLIGHSPDEADSVALGVYAMEVPSDLVVIGSGI